jgi:peptide/nickel transport system substrate-binding protein
VTYYAAFNTLRGPLADRALRQRLVQAVDVQKLVRQTLGRLAIPAHGLIPPGLLGHDPAPLGHARSQEIEPATSSALELTAVVNPVFFAGYSALYRELTGAFAQAGAKVRPVNTSVGEFLEGLKEGSADLVIGRWGADYPDADTFAYTLYSQGGSLGRFCGSAEVDRLLARGRAETTAPVRHATYREIEEIIAREALLLPLFHDQAYRFARPEIGGLVVSLGYPTVAYENLHIRG